MAPSNPSISDSRTGGEYRRRNNAYGYPSNAIAAAEAAASYILSDGPIATKRRSRTRSNSNSTSNTNGNSGNNNVRSGNGVPSGNGGSFLLRVHRQRERLMQRQKREKLFSFKVTAWIVALVVGILFLSRGEKANKRQLHSDTHISDHGGSTNNIGQSSQRIGVPLPPNMERKARRDADKANKAKNDAGAPLPPNSEEHEHDHDIFVASFVRGSRHHSHHKKQQGHDVKDEKQSAHHHKETEMQAHPKGIAALSAEELSTPHHYHAIPPTLIFTYHTNLLTTPESQLKDEEDIALAQNVKNTISLHNATGEATVRFLTDEDCLQSIRATLGPNTTLTKYFTEETHGMYKADICRGAALYETGGLYFDVDVEARTSLFEAVSPSTEFVTTLVHKDSNHRGKFFQAFIGSLPGNPIFTRYLELFVLYYEGVLKMDGPLGVYFLRMAFDAVVGHTPDSETIDLFQEVRYHPKSFPHIKRDHWGKRRACQMMVVAPPKKFANWERKEALVPMFSHANGSRMCGGKDTDKRGDEKQ